MQKLKNNSFLLQLKMENNLIRKYGANDDPILSEEEQKEIVEWTIENRHFLTESGINRYRQSLDFFDEIPECFNSIKKRIVDKENLHEFKMEPKFKDSIAYMTDGGKLHLHTDPRSEGCEHIRFNVYVQLPFEGGFPIYAGKEHRLKERTYICCRASIDKHECTMVKGDRARIIISYGFLIPRNKLGNVIYDY